MDTLIRVAKPDTPTPSLFSQNVSLTPELQRFIAEKVGSGRYRSASEVVREALRCLERHGTGEPSHDPARVERNEAAVALRESEERLRSLTANMPSAMVYQIVVSGEVGARRFSFVAESCERLNGVKADEVLRNPLLLYEMILPDHRESFAAAEARLVFGALLQRALAIRVRRAFSTS